MATIRLPDVIPGASLPLHLTVTDLLTGAAVNLDGATIEVTLTAGGGYSAAIAPTQVDAETWLADVGPAHTAPNRGRQMKATAWITPAASAETTAIEAIFNVKA